MAKSRSKYHSWAKSLKKFGVIDFDLRKNLTTGQKSAIAKMHAKLAPAKSIDLAAVHVKKSTDTGARLRIKNTVFVAREGAERVTWNKKQGTIVKTIKQKGSIKRYRAPMAPKPENLQAALRNVKKRGGKGIYVRSAKARGITAPSELIEDEDYLNYYLKRKITQISAQARKTKGMDLKGSRQYAREVTETFYAIEIETD